MLNFSSFFWIQLIKINQQISKGTYLSINLNILCIILSISWFHVCPNEQVCPFPRGWFFQHVKIKCNVLISTNDVKGESQMKISSLHLFCIRDCSLSSSLKRDWASFCEGHSLLQQYNRFMISENFLWWFLCCE